MESIIAEISPKLNEQLTELASKIRQMEADILTFKEGYLKVQGAIELLDVLKSKVEDAKTLNVIEEVM